MKKENTPQQARKKWNSGDDIVFPFINRYRIKYCIVDVKNASRVVETCENLDEATKCLQEIEQGKQTALPK